MALTFRQFIDFGYVPYSHRRDFEIINKMMQGGTVNTTVKDVADKFKFRAGDVLNAFWWAKGVTNGAAKVAGHGPDSTIAIDMTADEFNERVREAYE